MCIHYAKNSNVLLNNVKRLKISVANSIFQGEFTHLYRLNYELFFLLPNLVYWPTKHIL